VTTLVLVTIISLSKVINRCGVYAILAASRNVTTYVSDKTVLVVQESNTKFVTNVSYERKALNF